VDPVLSLFGGAVGVFVLYYAFVRCEPVERDRLLACTVLILFTIGFWAFYEQQGSSLNVFADRYVDRKVLGLEIPAPALQSLNPLFVLIGAPVASGIWLTLARHGRNPSVSMKFALAILQVSIAFLVLSRGAGSGATSQGVSLGWLVLSVFLMTTGELCLGPIGLAIVTKLAPHRLVGAMTGAFFLAYSAANFISGRLAQLTGSSETGLHQLDYADALRNYASAYRYLGLMALGAGAVLLVISPLLNRWLHESAPWPSAADDVARVAHAQDE
jgi:proton-dependent oligopeptide transporter, POT family